MAYTYNANIYCDDCGLAIKAELDKAGKRPDYPQPWDTDDYPAYAPDGGGETDCPQHCGHCHTYLAAPLTTEGVNYVLAAIRASLAEAVNAGRATTWDRLMPAPGTGEDTEGFLKTWAGQRNVEILRTWARDLSSYNLEKDEQAIVDLFLELSEAI